VSQTQTNLYVKLKINTSQRTKALSKGYIREPVDHIEIPVSHDAVKLFDSNRLNVYSSGAVELFTNIDVKNEDDVDKPTVAKLSEYGKSTDIVKRLVDFIIENDKKVFDEDCIRELYRLQDEWIDKIVKEVESRKEREREKRKARELLKNEIQDLKSEIKYLNEKINEKDKKIHDLELQIDNLEKKIEEYAKFVKEKGLVDDFVEFVMSGEDEEREKKILEEYKLEED